MELKLTRRQFGQLAIAGAVVAATGIFQSKVFSQAAISRLVIIGVHLGPIPSSAVTATTTRGLILESLDVETGQVVSPLGSPILIGSDEQITGFTSLSDGTFVVAITPISTSKKGEDPTYLIILDPSLTIVTIVTISGLKKEEQLRSLVGTKDGRLLGLVVKKNGTPPVRLVDVDWNTGNFTGKFTLPGNQRFSNLSECPDGTLYTTGVKKDGNTDLLLLDVQGNNLDFIAELKIDNTIWNNGLDSLICSEENQLFAFGALRYQYPKALYSVDVSSGTMTKLRNFDLDFCGNSLC
jgi:hypothetical protein